MSGDAPTVHEDLAVPVPAAPSAPDRAAEPIDVGARAARAAIAMLSLQLREAEHAALEAEEALASLDLGASRTDLELTLDGLVERRRREHAAELAEERRQADDLVRAAQVEAEAILAEAAASAAAAVEVEAAAAAAAGVERPPAGRNSSAENRPAEETISLPAARSADPGLAAALETSAVAPVAHPAATFDSVALSQAVAAAVAAVLADRSVAPHRDGLARTPAPHRAGRSALSTLAQLDVLLPLVAAALVLLVFWAWVG